MLKVGFDAKRAFLNRTGLGNYSRSVIRSLVQYYPENDYYLYSPEISEKNVFLGKDDNIHFQTPDRQYFKSLWRSWSVLKDLSRDQLDIYHGLSHELPFGIANAGIRSVVTIHDLIFFRYPEYYKFVDRQIYQAKFKYACTHADKIIAVSEQTKRDIQFFFKIPGDKIDVIYQSCAQVFKHIFTENQLHQVKAKYNLPSRFLLSVGTVEERKNLLLILKTLNLITNDLKLVVVGNTRTPYYLRMQAYIQQNRLEHRVQFLENLLPADLPAIYQLADIFIYPSRFEGFGIPVLEALTSGTPVIAAKGSCLEEAGGKESIYIDPDDEQELANAIQFIDEQPGKAAKMREEGRKHANLFGAERIAAQIMSLYLKLMSS